MLAFQRLDVYRLSIEFAVRAADLCRRVPKGHTELRDQLLRAATSVPLNIAEGCGRTSSPDGARHFAIARGSTMESAAIVDVLHALDLIDDIEHSDTMFILSRIGAMLTKLAR